MRARRLPVTAIAITAAAAWSIIPLLALAYHALRHGVVLSGSDGALAGADQLFYMDSIRQAGSHLLITDHFDLTLGAAVYLNPLYVLGGLLWQAGLSIQAVFWLLQLFGAAVLAIGVTKLVADYLRSRVERAIAVLLGLFYMSPLVPLLAWTGAITPFQRFELDFPAGESMPAWQLWGYPHSPIAVGLLAWALSRVVPIVEGTARNRWRTLAGVSLAALVLAWLHPWQGATFILVAIALTVRARSFATARVLALPVLAAGAPMVYERVLVSADPAWHLDSIQNAVGQGPVWMLALAVVPLALLAPFGYRQLSPGAGRTMLVVWPVAALAVYFATPQFPYHALEGIAVPLAVLAVAAWRVVLGRRFVRLVGVAAAGLVVAAGVAYELTTFRDSERSSAGLYWMPASDRRALAYLGRTPTPGGVFARYQIGMAVPAFSGRRTWVGEWTWTPDFNQRQVLAESFMQGQMSAGAARSLLLRTGARFVLVDCGSSPRVAAVLAPLSSSTKRFGCAVVYELRPASETATVPGLRRTYPAASRSRLDSSHHAAAISTPT